MSRHRALALEHESPVWQHGEMLQSAFYFAQELVERPPWPLSTRFLEKLFLLSPLKVATMVFQADVKVWADDGLAHSVQQGRKRRGKESEV